MDPRLEALIAGLRASGFSDLRGARADLTLPISDRLLTEALAQALPASAPVRDVEVTSRTANRIGLRFRVAAASFLPPLNVTLTVDEQPRLPASPVLILKLETGGLLSMAGSALRFLDALPPGLRVVGDRVHVDIGRLLAERGLAELLEYTEHIEVTTRAGAVVVGIRAVVRG